MDMAPRTALVCGASGLVGGYCLDRLMRSPAYGRVVVVSRRDLGDRVSGPNVHQVIVDFTRLDRDAKRLRADDVFCALGTTIRKAGSKRRFREVDYQYPFDVARLALAGGAVHFSLVSSLGADPRSRVFYTRTKGELEEGVRRLGFPSVSVFRPSVIAGPRREFRPVERISRWLLAVAPRRWRPVHADTIAAAMVARAQARAPGFEVIESADIARAASTPPAAVGQPATA